MRKSGETLAQDGHHQIAPDAVAQHEAAAAAIVGHETQTLRARIPDRGEPRGRAIDFDHAGPAPGSGCAVERGQQFRAPCAHDAGKADDLAGAHLERDAVRRLPAGARASGPVAGSLQVQHAPPERPTPTRIEFVERPADQKANELRLRRARRSDSSHLAVAQHRDPIGDARDLLEPMGDVNDADAARGDIPHHPKQPLDFGSSERGGWLVHHQDARGVGQRLHDSDNLPTPDRELSHRLINIDLDADGFKAGARRAPHRRPV